MLFIKDQVMTTIMIMDMDTTMVTDIHMVVVIHMATDTLMEPKKKKKKVTDMVMDMDMKKSLPTLMRKNILIHPKKKSWPFINNLQHPQLKLKKRLKRKNPKT